MATWNPFEPSRLSQELEDWLKAKDLPVKEAALVLAETLAQFIGFCPPTKEATERVLADVLERIKQSVEIASRSKKREIPHN